MEQARAANINAPTPNYAGFWRRCAASVIDLVFLAIPVVGGQFLILSVLAGPLPARPGPATEVAQQVAGVFDCIVIWMYFALFESSRHQATLGKQLFDLKVTDIDGRAIGFARASGRVWAKLLSVFPMYLGFVMPAFTKKKQALHDMVAGTLVIKTPGEQTVDAPTSLQATTSAAPPQIVEQLYPSLSTDVPGRPRSVITSVALLISSLLIGLAGSVLQLPKLTENPQLKGLPIELIVSIAVPTMAVVAILVSFLIYKIYQRRNWARITLLVLFILGIPLSIQPVMQSFAQHPLLGLLQLVQAMLQIGAIILLFVKPSRDWFTSQRSLAPARLDQR